MWKNATIALDTNVLLGLYRMPATSRKEIIDVLRKVQERVWVPYHVLVEYHSNRLNTLRDEFEAAEKMERDIKTAFIEFKAVVTEEKVTKRACWQELSDTFNEIEAKAKELYAIARKERANYIAPNQDDEIRDFLEGLLAGRAGLRPTDQVEVNAAEAIAKQRYETGLGPGHLDGKKEGTHLVDGLIYQRQYGDYMVWSGLLDHCRHEKLEAVIFVTSDVKDDWWLDTRGKAGKKPQPELVMEIRREAGVRDFGMYTLSTFVANAKTRLKLKVNDQTITDALQAEHVLPKRIGPSFWSTVRGSVLSGKNMSDGPLVANLMMDDYQTILRAVGGDLNLTSEFASVGIRTTSDNTSEVVLVASVQFLSESKKAIAQAILRRMAEHGATEWSVYFVPNPGESLVGRTAFLQSAAEFISPFLTLGTRVTFHVGTHTGPGRHAYSFTTDSL